ncbi:S9 family peptidase [Kutzneria chonburiensis]|uniref:Alpha/beta hydrolase family protein n=1 Tax=Kutzneria chonburiensis TaxID=1483604 RepID=A0ABV6MQI7_9PSEU|nr:alpha/beta fold hydrolase [Kutzneria chonburiensis]
MRLDFRIDVDARHAICLASTPELGPHLETWTRGDGGWQPGRMLCRAKHPQMLPMRDGRILVYDSADPVVRVFYGDEPPARLDVPTGFRFLRAPSPDRPGLAIVHTPDTTEVWRFRAEEPALIERVASIPGLVHTVLPLEPDWGLLAADRCDIVGGPREVVAIDLADGSHSTLLAAGSVLITHADTGLVVVEVSGRTGWTRIGSDLRFPAALNPGGEPMRPLAVSPTGDRLLVHRLDGVRSTLGYYDLDEDTVTPLDLPPGVVRTPARWTSDGVSFVFSTPAGPPRIVDLDRLSNQDSPAHVEKLGEIEAIVHGGPDWRDNPRLVLALHGGPFLAWLHEYSPLLHQIAATGTAIVAPNQRGSTGYGSAHTNAIIGDLGGPDLEDVTKIVTDLRRYRDRRGLPPLRLLGESYGGYLALLAAAQVPLDRCAVLAPFLSPRRLHADGGPGVRALLDSIAGSSNRDALEACGDIKAPLLIVHGTEDDVIPVSHSRTLASRLRRLGKDFRYVEIRDHGHEPADDPHAAAEIVAFLTEPPDPESSEGGEHP